MSRARNINIDSQRLLYAARAHTLDGHAAADDIRTVYTDTKGAYGSPRITRGICDRGYPTSRSRVERLMREHGIRARHKRRYKVLTDSKHRLPVVPNVLNCDFTPAKTNQVFSAGITYIWTGEGWRYPAVVLDLFNREAMGWSIKTRMTADLVMDVWTMTWFRRRPPARCSSRTVAVNTQAMNSSADWRPMGCAAP